MASKSSKTVTAGDSTALGTTGESVGTVLPATLETPGESVDTVLPVTLNTLSEPTETVLPVTLNTLSEPTETVLPVTLKTLSEPTETVLPVTLQIPGETVDTVLLQEQNTTTVVDGESGTVVPTGEEMVRTSVVFVTAYQRYVRADQATFEEAIATDLVKRGLAVWPKDAKKALAARPGEFDHDTDIG